MTRYFPAIAAAAIVVLAGLVHGLRTDRWWVSAERQRMAERVQQLPAKVGEWVADESPLDERQMAIAQADAAVSRRYVRQRPGRERDEVTLILMSGRAQPLAVHTPDICFANVGYQMDGEPRVFNPEVDGKRPHSFWAARFSKPSDPLPRRVYWSWSDGGRWRAADNPRGDYSRARGLYKLYLVCPLPTPLGPDELDPAQQLLADILPDMSRTLTQP